MPSPLAFKVYNPAGEYVGATKHAEDAACLVALHGDGAQIKHRAYGVVWNEGRETISAAESYDGVTGTVWARIHAKHAARLKKLGLTA
jgi:hypothetical protein